MERFIRTETWLATEITLFATKEYENPVRNVILDMEISNGTRTLTVPAFWNGKNEWCFRFALPEEGVWIYKTICNAPDENLNNIYGVVHCTKYSGDLEIFKRGFVTTHPDKKYLVYADGTPFFYLGDTHWNFLTEEFDSPGENACGIECDSHFKYIIQRRLEQGYTVYQTEAIGLEFGIADGIDENDLEIFKHADKYFKYIADVGLLHANAQFFFPSEMIELMEKMPPEEYEPILEDASRYWVARFGAFPCLWTLGQEIDNDFYYGESFSQNKTMTAENNPYKKVCQWMYKYDPLKQPISAHQEGSYYIGKYTSAINSAFYDIEGHTWWANQWKPVLNYPLDFTAAIDFWYNGQNKPIINYEARYELLWTNSLGARIQGWIAFLNGMFGHGYGAVDMWLYKSHYDIENPTYRDGLVMSVEDKLMPWGKAINLSGGIETAYVKKFFEKLEWWKMEPCFNLNEDFIADGGYYSASHIGKDIYIAYFYDKVDEGFTKTTGSFIGLDDNAKYVYQWYNPVTNTYLEEKPATIKDGCFKIEERPTLQDWVITLKKVK